MIAPFAHALAAVALLAPALLAADDLPDRAQVAALSKNFLRDSAELPMDVVVTTVVKDSAGKTRRNATSNVRFLFRGYNPQSQRYSFRANSGLMARRILHDSVPGNFAVIDAFTRLAHKPESDFQIDVQAGPPGEPFRVHSPSGNDCPQFKMFANFLYPERSCRSVDFRVRRMDGALQVESFALEIDRLPAAANIAYLGQVNIRRIHAEGEVQEATLPDDARPFLVPKLVTTTIETDKGTIVVTNRYALHSGAK